MPPHHSSVCVYGGVSKRDQVTALRKGAQIVVATPGRLEDLIQDNACRWGEVGFYEWAKGLLLYQLAGELQCQARAMLITSGDQNLALSPPCRLDDVSYLVLDEADRMLDLGFEPHIRAIASKTRADRQVRRGNCAKGAMLRACSSQACLGGVLSEQGSRAPLGPVCSEA